MEIPLVRLSQVGTRYYSAGQRQIGRLEAKEKNKGKVHPRWAKKPHGTTGAGAKEPSKRKRDGKLRPKREKDIKFGGPKSGLSRGIKLAWKEITKNKAATDEPSDGVVLQTWEAEGAMTLPHDRQTLYSVAEKLFHWPKWFPGCHNVHVVYTKSMTHSSGNTSKVPQSVKMLFGKSSLGADVRLKVQLQPGTRVQLVYKPYKESKTDRAEEYDISWHFKNQRDSSDPMPLGPTPIVGTHVRFLFRVRSYNNVISMCETTWGRGSDEEAESIIRSLGERVSYLQSEESTTASTSGPIKSPGLDPDQDHMPMLVRRQPARNLTMRERGGQLIRRVKSDGADEDELLRLHQRLASRDYGSDT